MPNMTVSQQLVPLITALVTESDSSPKAGNARLSKQKAASAIPYPYLLESCRGVSEERASAFANAPTALWDLWVKDSFLREGFFVIQQNHLQSKYSGRERLNNTFSRASKSFSSRRFQGILNLFKTTVFD